MLTRSDTCRVFASRTTGLDYWQDVAMGRFICGRLHCHVPGSSRYRSEHVRTRRRTLASSALRFQLCGLAQVSIEAMSFVKDSACHFCGLKTNSLIGRSLIGRQDTHLSRPVLTSQPHDRFVKQFLWRCGVVFVRHRLRGTQEGNRSSAGVAGSQQLVSFVTSG